MSVKVTGTKSFQLAMKKLGNSFDDAVDQGVFVTAQEVRTTAVKSIQEVSAGRQVQRSRQGGGGTYTHTAAAAGNAPNTDTGKLVASIATDKRDSGIYRIGSNLPYASYLEFGTSRMGSRPWLQPVMQAKRKNMIKNIQKVVDIYIERLA